MATEEQTEEPKAKQSRSAVLIIVLALFVILPGIYVFSVGPAVWLLGKGMLSHEFFQRAYLPLIWIHESEPAAAGLLDAYVRIFEK